MKRPYLTTVAAQFKRETGFDPQQFLQCKGAPTEKRAALTGDVEWYRRHTEDIAQRLRNLLR